MTEQEWLSSDDPVRMLRHLLGHPDTLPGGSALPRKVSPRKLRLFACGVARLVWDGVECRHCGGKGHVETGYIRCDLEGIHDMRQRRECVGCRGTGRVGGLADPRSRKAVEVAERYADGLATKDEVMKARAGAERVYYGDGGDGEASFELELACRLLGPVDELTENSGLPRWFSVSTKFAAIQADLLRCIAGNPFRPVRLPGGPNVQCPLCKGERVRRVRPVGASSRKKFTVNCQCCRGRGVIPAPCPWLTRNDGAVVKLARAIYESRHWDELPILADALEEAGVPAEEYATETRPAGYVCPKCGDQGFWRAGQEFDHMKKCRRRKCGLVWIPEQDQAVVKVARPHPLLAHLRGPGPHARGCHVLDLLLGKE